MMAITFSGWWTLSMISLGGALFKFFFIKFDDDFTCDIKGGDYSGL